MQAITWTLCNDKVGIGKYGTLAPIHKRFEKGLCFANNVEYELRFCPNDIKCCVSGKKKKYVLNCVEHLASGDRNQSIKEGGLGAQGCHITTFSHCRTLSTIATLPIPWPHFRAPQNLDVYPTFKFGKLMCCNLATLLWITKTNGRAPNSWMVNMSLESLPFHTWALVWYLKLFPRSVSRIVSQLATSHIAHARDFTKLSSQALGKKENGRTANIFIMCLDFDARWTTRVTNSFTHLRTPTTRSCNYLNLQVLQSVNNVASVVLSRMLKNVNEWHVLMWIVIINFSNGLKVF